MVGCASVSFGRKVGYRYLNIFEFSCQHKLIYLDDLFCELIFQPMVCS